MGLIAHYPLDGSADDVIGKTITSDTNVLWSDGILGGSGLFNSTNSYISIDNMEFTSPEFSIAAWVFRTGPSSNQNGYGAIFNQTTDSDATHRFSVYVRDTGEIGAWVWDDSAVDADTGVVLPSNEWHHIVWTQDKDNVFSTYLDGQRIQKKQLSGSSISRKTASTKATIGTFSQRTGSNAYDWNGKLSDVRVYDSTLSKREVTDLVLGCVTHIGVGIGNAREIRDRLSVSETNVSYLYDDDIKRRVMTFDGTGELSTSSPIPQQSTNQEWTVETLLKIESTKSTQYLINGFNRGLFLRYLYDRNRRPLMYLNAGSNDYYIYGTNDAVPLNEWAHVIYTFNNSTGYRAIYVNGVNVSTQGPNKTSTPSGIRDTLYYFRGFVGKVAFLKLYISSMSQETVEALFRRSLSLDSSDTIDFGYRRLIESKNSNKLTLGKSCITTSNLSEMGIVNGLLYTFPMTRHYRDLCSPLEAESFGVIIKSDGALFDGVSYLNLGELMAFGDQWTVMCVYRSSSFVEYTHLLTAYDQRDFAFKISILPYGHRPYFHFKGTSYRFNTSVSLDVTHHLAITYSNGVIRQYIDGTLDETHNVTIAPIPKQSYRVGKNTDEYSKGAERDLRIYGRSLSNEEIRKQYHLSMNVGTTIRDSGDIVSSGQVRQLD